MDIEATAEPAIAGPGEAEETTAPATSPSESAGSPSLAALYDVHAGGLYGYVLALLGSEADAEDVLHTVFLRALKRQQGFLGLRNPVGYLYRAARNEAFSRLRKRAVRERASDSLRQRTRLLAPVDDGVDRQEHEALEQGLAALPVEQREVVVLKTYQDKTFKEIGKLIGISANTAASRYRYALEKLRRVLREE